MIHSALEKILARAVLRSWHSYDGYGNGFCIHCEASDGFPHKGTCLVLNAKAVVDDAEVLQSKLRESPNESEGSW